MDASESQTRRLSDAECADLADLRDTYPAQEAIAAAQGWADPGMDEYDCVYGTPDAEE